MTFGFPFAFLALLAVPALVAIYWFRSKHKRQPVSTLMLWRDQREAKEGGLVLHRMQTPLLFFLELLTIVALILAAAGPAVTADEGTRSILVVLDDSFSMLAGSNDSARTRALEAVAKEIRGYKSVRLVLAGEIPQLIGDGPSDLDAALREDWKCLSPSANLDEAIAFAYALGQNRARILVVTDRPPDNVPTDGQLVWRAFGASRTNLAFVNATRTLRDDQERCLLEIANLSANTAKTDLVIESAGAAEESPQLRRSTIEIGPKETRRVLLRLKPGSRELRARVNDDELDIDNQIVLLPEPKREVRVELRFQADAMKNLVENALSATGNVVLTSANPDLMLTDHNEDQSGASNSWILRFLSDGDAQSYLGPFVLDRTHPLTEGLSLEGVVWAAAGTSSPSTNAVITAGNIPLLTDVERPDGRHDLRLRLRPDRSTLQDTPNWPILIWNLVDWRAASAPGLKQANLRLGDEALLRAGPESRAVELRRPDETVRNLTPQNREVRIRTDSPGIYELVAGSDRYAFAANALRQEESDLTQCGSGYWGEWQSGVLQVEDRPIGWLFLLLALLTFAIHLALTARGRRSTAG